MKILKKIMWGSWCFLRGYEEIVNEFPINRDKEKPWICYVHTPLLPLLLFGPYSTRMFIDTKHPDYYEEVLKPLLKQFVGYEIVDGKYIKTNSKTSFQLR